MKPHEEERPEGAAAPLLGSGADPVVHERLAALVVLIMAVATPVSVGFHYVMHYYWGVGYPWSTFLVNAHWRFNDYFLSYRDALWFRPGMYDTMVYSPVMHLIMTVLTFLAPRTGFALVVAAFVVVLVLVCWGWITAGTTLVATRLTQVAILVLLSYPVLFVIDRGNLEMVIFIFLAAFFYLYYVRKSRWAWIPLALAIGGKYYWVTLLIIPLSDRQLRQFAYAILGAIGASVGSALLIAWYSHYTVGWVFHYMLQTLGGREDALGSLHTVQHAHTAWASLQLANRLLGYPLSGVRHVQLGYILIAATVFLLIAYEVAAHDMAPWRKVLALVAATLILPFESFDYTLLHLYFPLALLVCTATLRPQARVAALAIAACLVPVDYQYFAIIGLNFDVGISTFIYAGALAVCVGVALVTGERERHPLRELLVWDSWSTRATAAPGGGEPPVDAEAIPARATGESAT